MLIIDTFLLHVSVNACVVAAGARLFLVEFYFSIQLLLYFSLFCPYCKECM